MSTLALYIVDVLSTTYKHMDPNPFITSDFGSALAYAESARREIGHPSMILTTYVDASKVLFCPKEGDTPEEAKTKFEQSAGEMRAH